MNAIQQTIKEQVEVSKPCPFMKRWWNSGPRVLKMKLNKLSVETTRQRAMPNHPCHEAMKLTARDYGKAIVVAKKHWADFLEEASDRDLWTSNRYLKDPIGDGGKSRIPMLKVKEVDGTTREIASNDKKAEVFHKVFFSPQVSRFFNTEDYRYSEPLPPPLGHRQDSNQKTCQGSLPLQS
jgi:hypothetical protein